MLRNQLLWLVSEKGHRAELETVVRDLWDLRIRGSSALELEEQPAEEELEVFSSQPPAEGAEPIFQPRGRAESWDPERGLQWPLPRVMDTIAMCYLGCLLLRIPTRLGELLGWARSGNLLYKRAVRILKLCVVLQD